MESRSKQMHAHTPLAPAAASISPLHPLSWAASGIKLPIFGAQTLGLEQDDTSTYSEELNNWIVI